MLNVKIHSWMHPNHIQPYPLGPWVTQPTGIKVETHNRLKGTNFRSAANILENPRPLSPPCLASSWSLCNQPMEENKMFKPHRK